MRVLVTGASGFVGRQLCEHLNRQGLLVRAAFRSRQHDINFPASIEQYIVGSIGADTDWSHALRDVDVVIHLAARVHVMQESAQDAMELYRQVNVQGTQALARQAAAAGIKRLIFLSSIKVNGEETGSTLFTVDSPDNPQDAYAVSKMEAEQVLHQLVVEKPMEIVIVRPPLVYGPGVKANFLRLIQLIERRTPLPFGVIKNKRSLLFVGNLVDALTVLATHPAAKGRTYLIADQETFSTPELITVLAGLFGKNPCLIPIPLFLLKLMGQLSGKSAEIERLTQSLHIDSSAIRNELNWTPPYSSIEGLRLTVEAYQNAARHDANRGGL